MNNEGAVRIRIVASDAVVSMAFSFRIISRLSDLLGKKFTVETLLPKKVIATDIEWLNGMASLHRCDTGFRDITKWSFPTACEEMERLVASGVNAIILSEEFLDWHTDKDCINDDLMAFEDFLERQGIMVIEAQQYNETENEAGSEFLQVEHWKSCQLDDILKIMVDDYKNASLVLPYGMLPYFQLNPTADRSSITGLEISAFVGFQPWSYKKAIKRFGEPYYPFIHWLPIEYRNIQAGPFPMLCTATDTVTISEVFLCLKASYKRL